MSFLEEIFGKDKKEVWRMFAMEIGGSYIDGHYGASDRIEIVYRQWIIVFDIYTHAATVSNNQYRVDYTRVSVSYISTDGLYFSVCRKGIWSTIGKLFGAQDIIVGQAEFDNAFIIKGNDEYKVQLLFSNGKLLELISAQKDIHIEVFRNGGWDMEISGDSIIELQLVRDGVVNDILKLKALHRLSTELLDQLSKISNIKALKSS